MTAAPLFQRPTVNWRAPDYLPVYAWRVRLLAFLRSDPSALEAFRAHYAAHPADFISDWGMTSDPRNIERGLPADTPFLLWPRQREWVEWTLDRWRNGEPGLTEKSRDSGASWLAIALACTLCLFNKGMVIGFGSRKEEYVDKIGAPKALFSKARQFLSKLPPEFLGGWERDKHAPHMRILFPGTDSAMTGESGDGMGRGDRTALYIVDEAAHIERPELSDASLSATTNCRIDISTPNGMANPFAQKRRSGKVKVFTFHWRDDPRKGEAWYAKQCRELDPVTIAQEVDINYSASVEGVVIPSSWVQAAVGAHTKLGIEPSGMRFAALDVADQGVDQNAFAGRHGILLQHLSQWSGKSSDIFDTVVKAFALCDEHGHKSLFYDADGLGAGVRGDARILNERRQAEDRGYVNDEPFRGSSAVENPDSQMVPGRYNRDLFANRKAQAWWQLRMRFQSTYRAVVSGIPADPDEIISLDPNLPELNTLLQELSQPTYSLNSVGKILIDKAPDGCRSPNLADAVMIAFASVDYVSIWMRL